VTRKLAGHLLLLQASATFTELLQVSTGNCGHERQITFWKQINGRQKTPYRLREAAKPTSRLMDWNSNSSGETKI